MPNHISAIVTPETTIGCGGAIANILYSGPIKHHVLSSTGVHMGDLLGPLFSSCYKGPINVSMAIPFLLCMRVYTVVSPHRDNRKFNMYSSKSVYRESLSIHFLT